jgi:hypothetical protein
MPGQMIPGEYGARKDQDSRSESIDVRTPRFSSMRGAFLAGPLRRRQYGMGCVDLVGLIRRGCRLFHLAPCASMCAAWSSDLSARAVPG